MESLLSDSSDKQTAVDEVLKLYDSLYQLYVFEVIVIVFVTVHHVTIYRIPAW